MRVMANTSSDSPQSLILLSSSLQVSPQLYLTSPSCGHQRQDSHRSSLPQSLRSLEQPLPCTCPSSTPQPTPSRFTWQTLKQERHGPSSTSTRSSSNPTETTYLSLSLVIRIFITSLIFTLHLFKRFLCP